MLGLQEIIGNEKQASELDPDKLAQEQDLLDRANKVRTAWNKPMTVTSGVRTWEHHLDIYRAKAANHQKPFLDGVFDESKVPKQSKHLETVTDCAAVDIADPGLEITKWLKENPSILEDAGLYCENGNQNWVHFQNKPFGSYKPGGTRWFNP